MAANMEKLVVPMQQFLAAIKAHDKKVRELDNMESAFGSMESLAVARDALGELVEKLELGPNFVKEGGADGLFHLTSDLEKVFAQIEIEELTFFHLIVFTAFDALPDAAEPAMAYLTLMNFGPLVKIILGYRNNIKATRQLRPAPVQERLFEKMVIHSGVLASMVEALRRAKFEKGED